ncbi:MAG: hypothetical protein Q8922_06795 [Bacteroidota bacterium]|nr:hypothetical protein [Bacteroidota bacterium]MDP4232698.1 hypothetical protein [Bacteroidota bacterium]MDP4243169.1 hypothetical protein [Bacteroidota bacterium]MDP4287626.1 hypothetical protein [Bacteroidota bacterium]
MTHPKVSFPMSKPATAPARPVRATPRQAPTRQTPLARAKKHDDAPTRKFEMPFEGKNIRIILLGVLVVGLGYLIMWQSPTMSWTALTLSPIILIIGYCVIIPYGILAGVRSKASRVAMEESSANGAA